MANQSGDDDRVLPFPTVPVSNMEWCPLPISREQRLVTKLVAEETDRRARRHGMTRPQFLRTAAATATAFMVMNRVRGLDQTGDAAAMPIGRVQCDDLDAARELLDRDLFVMDVQQHHVDTALYPGTNFCFLQFRPSSLPCPESIGQLNFVKEVFVDSETDVGVISGLPYGIPLGPAVMAETRDLVNELAGSERALSQAICDPKAPAGSLTSLDTLEHQVRVLGGRALKCYTYSYDGWRLDDEQVAYPMLAEASRLGLRVVNVHKGLPAVFAPGSPESVRTTDLRKVVADWPKLRFCAYHSGYFQDGTHPEGRDGIAEFLDVIAQIPRRDRRRVYAEIGSTFAIVLGQGPDRAAHFIGALLKALGPKNILWGTDSIWWGSPQYLIDAFKTLQIPAPMQEQYGYPPLTEAVKKRILGVNAAKLYGVKPRAPRCTVPPDRLQQVQLAGGGPRTTRSLRWYGPQTRREFFTMLRAERASA